MNKIFSTFILFAMILGCSSQNKIKNEPQKQFSSSQDNSYCKLIELGNGWFEATESVAIENISPEEAKEKAIWKSCKKAVEYFGGIQIEGSHIDVQAEDQDQILLDNFASITRQTTRGIILDKEVIQEKIVASGNQLQKVVTIKVKVGKQKGEKDPNFEIEASLNRENFKDGEEIVLEVEVSKDCYLTVFNVCSNDSVYIIFPNEFRKDNFIKNGEKFMLPNSKDEEMGICFPVNLLPNKDKDAEMIKVIATKKKIDFSSNYSFSAYGTHQSALRNLQKRLLDIPLDEIEEEDLQYFISKN